MKTAEEIVRALAARPQPKQSTMDGPSCALCSSYPGQPCQNDCPYRMAQEWAEIAVKIREWGATSIAEQCRHVAREGNTTYHCRWKTGHPLPHQREYDKVEPGLTWRLRVPEPPTPVAEFMDYFTSTEEYPEPTESMLRPGLCYEYISSTFLDGWINYVEIKAAWLLTRYRGHSQNIEQARSFNDGKEHHTSLGQQLDDDVLILARSKHRGQTSELDDEGPCWWYFWYDRDCSDCCIGRFETDNDEAVVLARFALFAEERSQDHGKAPAIELKPSAFRGWISG